MKKFTILNNILLSVLSTLMFSCNDTDLIIENKTYPIEFNSSYIGTSTSRALGDIDNTNVKSSSFYVYGQEYDGLYSTATQFNPIFDQQLVTYTGSKWTYSPLKYWNSEKKYTFTAVMPENISTSDISYNDGRIFIKNIPLTQPISQDQEKIGIDYLVSKTVDDHNVNKGTVLLQFKHILSRFSVYVYTGDNSAQVTLNSMNIWLPEGKANYEEINHSGPVSNVVNATSVKQVGDKWTWFDFENKIDGVNSTYKKHSLFTDITNSVNVPYFDGIPETSDAQLLPVEFFMAPIDKSKFATKEDLQLYMELSFHVKYADNIEQDIVKNTPILIHDLHSFTQNYKTNLFVKLLSENDIIAFNVTVEDYENETNHWVDQYGYSFDLKEYNQTFEETFPQDEISGILYDYGNTNEGDSDTKMSYRIKSLTLEGSTTPVITNLPMIFSKWGSSLTGSFNTETLARTKEQPYGKFIADLSDVNYTSGYYKMIVENSMGDVREYRIYLQAPAYMAFTITVKDNDQYTIPFVTYETVTNYWANTVGKYLKSGVIPITMEMVDEITPDENKNLYFKYPSNLRIYWGDNSEITKIAKGDLCVSESKLTHTYTTAGDYQIIIRSDARYSESQIPQISWGQQATQNNPLASITNGNGYTDNKIKSMDTPVLRIYEDWEHWETTFGAYALAAGNGAKYDWMADIVYSWINPSFSTGVKSSPITSMFHNSSIQHVSDNLFIYNGTYAKAADYTFLMCSRLDNIGAGMFDYCSNIVSMISTFDGDGNHITEIPDGLFDYLTGNIYFFQTFVGCPITYVPSDLFAHCGAGSIYKNIGITIP